MVGIGLPVTGAQAFLDYLFNGLENDLGGRWGVSADPHEIARKMIEHIDQKRKELGIDKARERVLYDMEARRQLESEVA